MFGDFPTGIARFTKLFSKEFANFPKFPSSDPWDARHPVTLGFFNSNRFGLLTKTGADTIVAANSSKLVDCSGTFTLSIAPVASLPSSFNFQISNTGTGIITIDPNASEQIDGANSIRVYPGEQFTVYKSGSAFKTYGRPKGWITLESKTAANATSLDFTTFFTSDFTKVDFLGDALLPVTNNVWLGCRFSQDGGATYLGNATDYGSSIGNTTRNANTAAGSNGTRWIPFLGTSTGNAATNSIDFTAVMKNPLGTVKYKRIDFNVVHQIGSTANEEASFGSGQYLGTNRAAAVNGIRFLCMDGSFNPINIDSGTITMRGWRP